MTACPACGSAIVDDSRFCGQCGHVIDAERTRRVPTTIDEATQDPNPANAPKPTMIGSADLAKTIQDATSSDRLLASLEWNAPPSEPKVGAAPTALGVPVTPSAVPTNPAPAVNPSAVPTPRVAPPTALGIPVAPGSSPNPSTFPTTPVQTLTAPTTLGVPLAAPAPAAAAPAPAPAPSERKPMFNATMIGGSITAADVAAEATRRHQGPPPAGDKLKTMVGHAVLDKSFDSSKEVAAPVAPPSAPSQPEVPAPDPLAVRPVFKTMMGVALPGIAPIRDSERSMAGAQVAGTLHGGIAAPAPVPPASNRQLQPVPPIVPPPAPVVEEPLPAAPRATQKKGISAVVLVSILVVVVIAIGTVAAVFAMRAGAPLSAKARLDESGRESLDIRCESCPDETKISLGASQATVTGSAALLPLSAPLKIGENDLDIGIDRPGAGRDETVKVHVPIAYRVKADLTTLASMPPVVTVRVEAAPGTEVTVDDKAVELDASGKGSYAIDVSADALGPSDEQKAIDRKIAFSVKRKGAAAAEPGALVVRAAIVPFHMDAPGADLYTAGTTANIVGQTKPGAVVTVDGQAVAVDANGRFAIRAELPSEGEKILTLVANAPPLAPRTIRAKVTRVASLEAQAKAIDATTPLGFDAYGPEPASKIGSMVAINGEIVEIRNSPGYAVMVVEEKKSCAAGGGCIVRLAIGEDIKASRGDLIRAYGHVAGTVAWNNKTVPAVTGTLAIASKAPAKK
jgi:hypothetical protein